ncbi:MAG TPA: hypothetical protein EYQ50_17835 [Verrucomicrobiales bacterium]|nr:hypothetical protein [Verrucomicrobiales bacterium]
MNRLGQTLLNGLLNMTIRHLHLAVTCCFASLLWVTAHGQNTFSGSKSLEDIASDPQNPKPNVLMIVIDDLNDQHQTNYRLSDYRMNRQLPIPLKSVLRTRYRKRALEQSHIIEIIDKKTQRIPVISGALLLLLGAILLL